MTDLMNDDFPELEGCLSNLTVLDKSVLTQTMAVAMDRPFFRVLRIVEPLLMVLSLGLMIWSLVSGDAGNLPLWCGFLLVMTVFFYVQQFVWYPRKAVKDQLTRQALDDGQAALENRLYFTEENIANRRGDSDQLLHMDYDKLKRLTETRRLLILTTKRNRLIPLDKKGFQNGTPEDLIKLLRHKAPNLKE